MSSSSDLAGDAAPPLIRRRAVRLALGVGPLILAAGLLAAAMAMNRNQARAMSPTWTVWGIEAALCLLVVALIASAGSVVRWLGRARAWWLAGVCGFAFALTLIAPRTHRILFDEVIYENIGQAIAHTGKAQLGSYGHITAGRLEVRSPTVNKHPNGHPYLLSIVYRAFGVSENYGPWLSRVCTAATAGLVFLTVVTLLALVGRDPVPLGTGLALAPPAAAVVAAMTPLVIWWSSTVASEPSAALFNVLAIWSVLFYVASQRVAALARCRLAAGLLMAGALGATFYFRMESALVAAVAMLALFVFGDGWKRLETLMWLGTAALCATPQAIQAWTIRDDGWGAKDGVRFSLDFAFKNLSTNLGYFGDGKWFPQAFSVLALIGIVVLWRHSRRACAWVAAWFLAAWGLFIPFYAGSYDYGADSRFAVISAAPVAVLAGFGAVALIVWLRRSNVALTLAALVLVVHWSAHARFVTTVGRQAEDSRADVGFVRDTAKVIPDKSLVLTNLPYAWQLNGVSAGELNLLHGRLNDMPALVEQYPGGVYLHWGYWAAVRPGIATQAREIIARCQGELVLTGRSGIFKFGLIRLDTEHAMRNLTGKPLRPRRTPGGDLEDVFPKAFADLEPLPGSARFVGRPKLVNVDRTPTPMPETAAKLLQVALPAALAGGQPALPVAQRAPSPALPRDSSPELRVGEKP